MSNKKEDCTFGKKTSKLSVLLCIKDQCPHFDNSLERNCNEWCPKTKCGFEDVSEYLLTKSAKYIPQAEPAGYTELIPNDGFDVDSNCGDLLHDMVNQPPHYQFTNELEVIDVIKIALEKNLCEQGPVESYLYSQVLKYLLRCGCKDNMIEDLKKAKFYLKDLIKEMD